MERGFSPLLGVDFFRDPGKTLFSLMFLQFKHM